MRIVYLHQYFETPQMPGGSRAYEFARRLAARGHEVHVLTSDTSARLRIGSSVWATSTEAGVHVHWARVRYENEMSYARRLRSFAEFGVLAARRAAAIPQDLVFASSTPLTIAIPAVYSARRNRAPLVLEIRDVWPEVPIALGALKSPLTRRAALSLEGWAYRNAEQVIALSPGMAESIRRRYPQVGVTVVPQGCDTELFAGADAQGAQLRTEYPWLRDRPLVVYAGTFGFANGVQYVVEIATVLKATHPDIRFALAGRGSEQQSVLGVAAQRDVLNHNLFFLGTLPKSEVVALLGACDLALSTFIDNPALWANSANKVFDAFAAGRPVALNHEGWLADLVRETGSGIVLPPNDAPAAAEAIAGFVYDRDRMAAARSAASRLARERFDRDKLFLHWEEVLLEAAGHG